MQKQLVACLLALAADAVLAQAAARPDPADPRARTPAIEYRSAFDGYRGYSDKDRASWRAANDQARQLGGHAGQVRSSSAPKPGARDEKSPSHGGHR